MRRIRSHCGPFPAWSLALALLPGACGGSEPPARAPMAVDEVVAPPSAHAGQAVGPAEDLPGDAKTAYDRGFQSWGAGDLQGARAAFAEAVAKAPDSGSARYSLACVLERLGDTSGALDAYRAAYASKRSYEAAAGGYTVLLAQTGRGPEAEQFLVAQRGSHPDSVALTVDLAEVKSIEGDSPGCQKLAQEALTKQPDSKDAMLAIARDYYRGHRWDLARYALGAILDGADDGSIPPRGAGDPSALLLRGLIERDSGQRKQAIDDFEHAVAQRPNLFEAYVNLGEMKLEAGNATEAQEPLERAVKFAPNVAVAHLDLGECYRLLGRAADAKKEFDVALGGDSTLAGVHYDLGLLYLFSVSIPGAGDQDQQLNLAIAEFQHYKAMRGAKAAKGPGDDVDELLSTAKRKQSELQLKRQAAAAALAAPAPSAGPSTTDAGPAGGPSSSVPPAASTAPEGSGGSSSPSSAPGPGASGDAGSH